MKATHKILPFFLFLFSLHTFGTTPIESIFANQNFRITQQQDEMIINMTKNPWESFTMAVNPAEIQSNPVVNIDIQTNKAITLRVDLTDGIFMSSEAVIVSKEVRMDDCFTTVSFDFTEIIHNINLQDDVYLIFYVNPGECYKGQISIRNFNLGETIQNKSFQKQSGFKMFPAPATTFTNIEIPDADFTSLTLMDMKGRILQNADIAHYHGSTYTLPLNNIPAGLYSVQLSGHTNTISGKLIIH